MASSLNTAANKILGDYLAALRLKTGTTYQQIAEKLTLAHSEKIKLCEEGKRSLRGTEIVEALQIYGFSRAEVSEAIFEISYKIRDCITKMEPIPH